MQTSNIDGKSFIALCESHLTPDKAKEKEKAKISNTSDIGELQEYANAYCRYNNPGSEYAVEMMNVVLARARELRDKLISLRKGVNHNMLLLGVVGPVDMLDEILALA